MSAITSRNGAFKSIKELLRVMKLFKDAMYDCLSAAFGDDYIMVPGGFEVDFRSMAKGNTLYYIDFETLTSKSIKESHHPEIWPPTSRHHKAEPAQESESESCAENNYP